MKRKITLIAWSLALLWTSLSARAEQNVTLTTSRAAGQQMTLRVGAVNGVTVDWGDGTPVKYAESQITGTVQGATVTLTGDDYFLTLDCSGAEVTAIDLSQATGLVRLNCADNLLTALSLSKMTRLEDLDCSNNQLATLSVTAATGLKTLNCSGNQLTTLSLSGMGALQTLICDRNSLTGLVLTAATSLETLWCEENQLSSLSLTRNTALKTLLCGYNNLAGLTAYMLTALENVWCPNNRLAQITLTNANNLQTLVCDSNQVNTLGVGALSANNKMYYISLAGNKLTLDKLPLPTQTTHYNVGGQADVTLSFTELNVKEFYDVSAYLKNSGGSSVGKLAFYDAATDRQLDNGVSQTTKDYYYTSGRIKFWKPFASVYGIITASSYPGLSLRTSTFRVVDPDGVGGVTVNEADTDDALYNLQGQRVTRPTKGIYVKGGRKIVVK